MSLQYLVVISDRAGCWHGPPSSRCSPCLPLSGASFTTMRFVCGGHGSLKQWILRIVLQSNIVNITTVRLWFYKLYTLLQLVQFIVISSKEQGISRPSWRKSTKYRFAKMFYCMITFVINNYSRAEINRKKILMWKFISRKFAMQKFLELYIQLYMCHVQVS